MINEQGEQTINKRRTDQLYRALHEPYLHVNVFRLKNVIDVLPDQIVAVWFHLISFFVRAAVGVNWQLELSNLFIVASTDSVLCLKVLPLLVSEKSSKYLVISI